MPQRYSEEILRFASSIIARHGSQAASFAERMAGDSRAAGSEDKAREWTSISTAIRAIEGAVPLPDLDPIAWPRGHER